MPWRGQSAGNHGVLGFIADAVSDQQMARAQAQQLEEKAQLAWAKENAKLATAGARDSARQTPREVREREIGRSRRGPDPGPKGASTWSHDRPDVGCDCSSLGNRPPPSGGAPALN